MKKKVYVALSGGVDSAVSAALLKRNNFAVVSIHMKLATDFFDGLTQANPCTGQSDLDSARQVANYLNIPFEVWDFTKEYKKMVVEYLFREYGAGRTPNPDVMCNRHIKFGLFYDKAMSSGADFVATGHYARIERKSQITKPKSQINFKVSNFKTQNYLLRGKDPAKDQSYFLWAIPKEKLSKVLFPIGGQLKTEVRALAKAFGLPNADRKDSQGVCFIGKIDLPEFLKLRLPAKKGQVVTTSGEIIGEHSGSWYYTVGQRHGFGSAVGKPQYIVEKNVRTNQLVVGENDSHALYSREAIIGSLNWLVDDLETGNLPCGKAGWKLEIEVRYHQKPVPAVVTKIGKGRLKVRFSEPIWALAPGQSMVLYKGAQVLGGGIIERAFFNSKIKRQNAEIQLKS